MYIFFKDLRCYIIFGLLCQEGIVSADLWSMFGRDAEVTHDKEY
jgi:hypothetical protein